MNQQWIINHAGMIVLSTFVFIQWVVLQVLVIHYHQFRKSLKKPRPDGIRMGLMEKNLSLHHENMEVVFRKLAELRREISLINAQPQRAPRTENNSSIEGNLVSLGELNFKKSLQRMSESSEPTTH